MNWEWSFQALNSNLLLLLDWYPKWSYDLIWLSDDLEYGIQYQSLFNVSLLCSIEDSAFCESQCRFGTTQGWVNDTTFIWGLTISSTVQPRIRSEDRNREIMKVQCCSYGRLFLSQNENIKKGDFDFFTFKLFKFSSHTFFSQLPIYISQFRHLFHHTIYISQFWVYIS